MVFAIYSHIPCEEEVVCKGNVHLSNAVLIGIFQTCSRTRQMTLIHERSDDVKQTVGILEYLLKTNVIDIQIQKIKSYVFY